MIPTTQHTHGIKSMNSNRLILIFSTFCLLLCAAPSSGNENLLSYTIPEFMGNIQHNEIAEVSGIAPSHRTGDLLWMINDSGNKPRLYAVKTDGTFVAWYRVRKAKNHDWEDLSSFVLGGKPYLLIPDVGDNEGVRKSVSLYLVEEPVIKKVFSKNDRRIPKERRIKFTYEDGPRDCEAVAVDVTTKSVLLLTKRTTPPVLYRLDLFPEKGKKKAVARRVTEVTGIPDPTKEDLRYRYGRHTSLPTAMDISPDGLTAVVLTYKHAYLFKRKTGETWKAAFSGKPRRVPLPGPGVAVLVQREAICFDAAGRDLFVTSEQLPAPIYRMKKRID